MHMQLSATYFNVSAKRSVLYIYIYIYIYTIVNWKIKVPTGGIYTIYYPVAVINDIH